MVDGSEEYYNMNNFGEKVSFIWSVADLLATIETLPNIEIGTDNDTGAIQNCETAHIDALVEKVDSSIAMIREYGTALISVAGTGKIDVQDEVFA